jgi:hypothetical protein
VTGSWHLWVAYQGQVGSHDAVLSSGDPFSMIRCTGMMRGSEKGTSNPSTDHHSRGGTTRLSGDVCRKDIRQRCAGMCQGCQCKGYTHSSLAPSCATDKPGFSYPIGKTVGTPSDCISGAQPCSNEDNHGRHGGNGWLSGACSMPSHSALRVPYLLVRV